MHIPKTGGNTFRAHLRDVFDDDICFVYMSQWQFVDAGTPTPMMRLYRRLRALKSGLRDRSRLRPTDRCIHGHFRAESYLARFPDSLAITWVRDPVERLLSQYYYWKRRPFRGHSVCNLLIRDKLSPLEFAEIEIMRNLQCRYFNTKAVQDFKLVGITEQFDACVDGFYGLVGVQPKHGEARNRNPHKSTARYEIDPAVRARIAALNSQDCKLYDQAVEQALKAGLFTDLKTR
jgi:sulfotransferase famil protein